MQQGKSMGLRAYFKHIKNISYSKVLLHEFGSHQKLNPHFCLEDFAKLLGTTPQKVKILIKGQKKIKPLTAILLCLRLEFNEIETKTFLDLVNLRHTRGSEQANIAERLTWMGLNLEDFQVTPDPFEVIKDESMLKTLRIVNKNRRNEDIDFNDSNYQIGYFTFKHNLESLKAAGVL
jgi:plasmid maintenance system antidote protein VapI